MPAKRVEPQKSAKLTHASRRIASWPELAVAVIKVEHLVRHLVIVIFKWDLAGNWVNMASTHLRLINRARTHIYAPVLVPGVRRNFCVLYRILSIMHYSVNDSAQLGWARDMA